MDQSQKRFRLTVEDTASADYSKSDELVVETSLCLRHLPGRRTVWKALCQGTDVLLKVFDPHPKQRRDVDREWNNTSKLYSAGLSIPAPLLRAKVDGGLVAVVYTFIEGGRTLDEVLVDADEATQSECMRQLVVMHVRQHALGSYQSDDHLGNYLWSGGQLYLLDAGSCVMKPNSLGLDDRVKNMAMLTANIPMAQRSHFELAYSHYEELCLEEIDPRGFKVAMARAVPEAVSKRLGSYLRKTRRSSSKLEHQDFPSLSWHACRDMDAALKGKLVENPEQFFKGKARLGSRSEQGERYAEVDIEHEGRSYVLRRYDQPSLGYRLCHFFSFPRALRVWSNGHALRMVGMASTRPVACMIYKKWGMQAENYVLLEKPAGEPLPTLDESDLEEDVKAQLVSVWRDLKFLRASHQGVIASDLMVDGNGRLSLVDTASIRFHQSAADDAQ
ncbi:MAG: hypothetical protein KJO21_05920 [Verrucomicrobiae bacterium]|nr:hypothetical protein [Verrucomicrobiae bacterium]NNJ43713.1 hypothetical protein [Akkermansiaceae bacterium]